MKRFENIKYSAETALRAPCRRTISLRPWSRGDLDAVVSERSLENLAEVWKLLHDLLKGSKKLLVLDLFNLSKNLIVFLRIFEIGAFYCPHIVQLGLESFLGTSQFVCLLGKLLIEALSEHILVVSRLMKLLLLCLDLHQSSSVFIVVLL